MDDYTLLIDLHKRRERQGPGGEKETEMAIELAGLSPLERLKIADIGCGTGASTLLLAKFLNTEITAVDFLPDFIEVLKVNAADAGLADCIHPLVGVMDDLPFGDEEFDVLWSEGAIYNMGFEKGVNAWKRFLQPGGLLVVSEITWTGSHRPREIEQYWGAEYPEIDTASAKIGVLEQAGYSPLAHFFLPEECWLDNYYRPLQDDFGQFLARNDNSDDACAIVEAERKEIALYKQYRAYYSYGLYVARRPA